MLRRCAVLLLALPVSAQRVAEAAEPNATLGTATVLALGAEGYGTLANTTDVDWWRLVLPGTRDLRVETGPGASAQVGDTYLSLLDANGNVLAAADDGVATGYYAQLQFDGLAAGTYYIAVERGSAGASSGSYVLDARALVPATFATPPISAEGPENNDVRSGGIATSLVLPARGNGLLATTGAGGDWDFWRFNLAVDSFVQVRVGATASHPQSPKADDLVLSLFDTASPPNLVVGPLYANDIAGWDNALDVRLPAGNWQIAVRGWVGSVAGRYYVDVFRADAGRSVVAAGGCGGRVLGLPTTNLGPQAPLVVERPTLGNTFTLRGSSLGSGGFAFFALGFSATFVDLTPLGAPGCALEVVYADTPLVIADGAGIAQLGIPVPFDLALVGASLEGQIAVLDFANALGLSFSNRTSAVIGS